MPAKIPRPIGSTEIFFPGIWKADSAVEDGEEEEALSATVTAGVPLLLGVDTGTIAAGEVGDEVVLVGSGTVESPTTDTPGADVVVADEDVEDGGADDKDVETMEMVVGAWDPATSLHCLTTCTRGSPFGPVIGVNVMVHV